MEKTPQPTMAFSPGPSLEPNDKLLDWLSLYAKAKVIRLPMTLRFDDAPLAIKEAYIAKTNIFLHLDDSALGISLVDRVRNICTSKDKACSLWLEGRWPEPLPSEPITVLADPKRTWPFWITKVAEPIKSLDAVTNIFISEGQS